MKGNGIGPYYVLKGSICTMLILRRMRNHAWTLSHDHGMASIFFVILLIVDSILSRGEKTISNTFKCDQTIHSLTRGEFCRLWQTSTSSEPAVLFIQF